MCELAVPNPTDIPQQYFLGDGFKPSETQEFGHLVHFVVTPLTSGLFLLLNLPSNPKSPSVLGHAANSWIILNRFGQFLLWGGLRPP